MSPGEPWIGMAVALLLGLLVGLQREMVQTPSRAGLRDFLITALVGGLCGILQDAALTAALLGAVVAVTLVCSWRGMTADTGMTTELAVVATFALGFTSTAPGFAAVRPVAVSVAVVLVAALEAKRALDKFAHETITASEFSDTIRFLAAVFVIYPILPRGAFGPYDFFEPRLVWVFVILVSSISFAGYFLEKFFGAAEGLRLTAVLGALTSTTAVTASLAEQDRANPGHTRKYGASAVLANAIQFPRVWAILAVVHPSMAARAWPVFAAAAVAGLLLYAILDRGQAPASGPGLALRNPFRLVPALKFGAVFSAILLLMKWVNAEFGGVASSWTGALAGALDVDSVTVSVTRLTREGSLDERLAIPGIYVAMISNAVAKTAIASAGGSGAFGRRVGGGLAVMLGAGAVALWITFYRGNL